MWKLAPGKAGKELRVTFVETLQDMMKHNNKIMALEADLGGASGFTKIQKTNPEQFVQVGIAEANMVGVAAGLSMRGYIPYIHTFAPFSTRRACDQIFLEGLYAGNTINIYGSDPGICVGANGGTHNTFEDISILRALPNMMILAPADDVQLEWCIREVAGLKGVHYIRANRKANARVYAEGSDFEIGKGNIIRRGEDVLIVSMGEMLSVAYEAAEQLEEKGISAEVIDMFTIKPFDADLVLKEAAGKKLVVSFENHNITGGLGDAVAEVLADHGCGIPLKRIGIQDQFGQVGTYDYLQKVFGLTAEDLSAAVSNILK